MFTYDELLPQMEGLRRFSMKLTRSSADSDDLLQSTVLRALEKNHLFEDGTNLFRWTSKIMFNLFVNEYNRKLNRESQFDPEAVIASLSVMPDQVERLEVQDVHAAINRLSPSHREIIETICCEGLSYEETAERLNIAIGTVRSRLSRARESLMAELGEPREKITLQ